MFKESRMEDVPDVDISIKKFTVFVKFLRKFFKSCDTRVIIIISSSAKIKSVGVILLLIRSK